jgi:hypothetical protein
MSEYDSLSRDELIRQLAARDWMLNRYRRMTDKLERDVEFYEASFEDAKDEVYRLRNDEPERPETYHEYKKRTGEQ